MNIPVWKCKACGCLWRDNLDDSVSLLDAQQKSCAACEHAPTKKPACEIHWIEVAAESRVHALESARLVLGPVAYDGQGGTMRSLYKAEGGISVGLIYDRAVDGYFGELATALASSSGPPQQTETKET